MEINSYGTKFVFPEDKNREIINFDWFVDVLKNETWEPTTFEIFDRLKDDNKFAIDVGAWIGPTTIYLSKLFKEVISIEADNVAFNALVNNVKESGCNNVHLHNKAFYKSGFSEIVFGVNNHSFEPFLGSSTSQTKEKITDRNDYIIKTITIHNIISKVNPNNIGLIKIDIEGGDEEIIDELINVGSNYGWKIWISFHYEWWKNKNIDRFVPLLEKIKKVSLGKKEIEKNDLLPLIKGNVSESFLIEL